MHNISVLKKLGKKKCSKNLGLKKNMGFHKVKAMNSKKINSKFSMKKKKYVLKNILLNSERKIEKNPFYFESNCLDGNIIWFISYNLSSCFYSILGKDSIISNKGDDLKFFKHFYDNENKLFKVKELLYSSSEIARSFQNSLSSDGTNKGQIVSGEDDHDLSSDKLKNKYNTDNPLYVFDRFFNYGRNADKDYYYNLNEIDETMSQSERDEVQDILILDDDDAFRLKYNDIGLYRFNFLSSVNMISSIKEKDYGYKTVENMFENSSEILSNSKVSEAIDDIIKSVMKLDWKIIHCTNAKNIKVLMSSLQLDRNNVLSDSNTYISDKHGIRNNGFTFFTLFILGSDDSQEDMTLPNLFKDSEYEVSMMFKDIPLASVSADLFNNTNKIDSDASNVPCFNGTSEEIKEQLIRFYLYGNISQKSGLNDVLQYLNDKDEIIDDFQYDVNDSQLEARLPFSVFVQDKLRKRRNYYFSEFDIGKRTLLNPNGEKNFY